MVITIQSNVIHGLFHGWTLHSHGGTHDSNNQIHYGAFQDDR